VAWILICKRCKFGGKICYNSRDIEFFLRDYFFLARPVYLCLRHRWVCRRNYVVGSSVRECVCACILRSLAQYLEGILLNFGRWCSCGERQTDYRFEGLRFKVRVATRSDIWVSLPLKLLWFILCGTRKVKAGTCRLLSHNLTVSVLQGWSWVRAAAAAADSAATPCDIN